MCLIDSYHGCGCIDIRAGDGSHQRGDGVLEKHLEKEIFWIKWCCSHPVKASHTSNPWFEIIAICKWMQEFRCQWQTKHVLILIIILVFPSLLKVVLLGMTDSKWDCTDVMNLHHNIDLQLISFDLSVHYSPLFLSSLTWKSSPSPLPMQSCKTTYGTPDSDTISGLPFTTKSQSRIPNSNPNPSSNGA